MKDMLNVRVVLLLVLSFIGLMLYDFWQVEHMPSQTVPSSHQEEVSQTSPMILDTEIPQSTGGLVTPAQAPVLEDKPDLTRLIFIDTDVLQLQVDRKGGDVVYAALKQYPQVKSNPEQGFVLLDRTKDQFYIAQTGLSEKFGPDSRQMGRALYDVSSTHFTLKPNEDTLNVDMTWRSTEGVAFTKTITLKRGSYLVDVVYHINNEKDTAWSGKMYGQLQRRHEEKSSSFLTMGMQTYQGAAVYTPEKKYKKVTYKDMDKQPFDQTITGGWAAMVEHYFLSAWIPSKDTQNEYFTTVIQNDKYSIGSLTSVIVPAHGKGSVQGQLYLGPEIASNLEHISDGLNLTVDYGILWPISQLIFWLLTKIHHVIGNWGWSIILVTVFIKALFYKLSASSYRSMGHLRRVQPKIQALKERHGDDKQKFSQEMMDLYRKEKINPLGGCLPILVQIPVFIALYYVLLESVELRQAPFMFWIQDLSAKDPYYVLPLLMGATMLIQQKLSPAPPDPLQAKMMMIMPILFTALFLSFPSGLVLYWVVNNVLSILQQWYIMRKLDKEGIGYKSSVKST
jgi:YidC/Oxa1 family membrane protein insertase